LAALVLPLVPWPPAKARMTLRERLPLPTVQVLRKPLGLQRGVPLHLPLSRRDPRDLREQASCARLYQQAA